MKIFKNISDSDYNKLDGARSTILSTISKKTLAHAKWMIDNKAEQKEHFKIGQATHDYLLRPDVFASKWGILSPTYKGTTTAGKEEKAKLAEYFNENILKYDDYQEIMAYRMSLESNAICKLLMSHIYETELSLQWEENGILCKARIDALAKLPNGQIVIIDLKTTRDASFDAFQKSVINYNYHIQTAHYLAGLKACNIIDKNNNQFAHVCIEKEAPYLSSAYILDDASIEVGNSLRVNALAEYSNALKSGKWTGYKERLQDVALPTWYLNKEDYELDEVA